MDWKDKGKASFQFDQLLSRKSHKMLKRPQGQKIMYVT